MPISIRLLRAGRKGAPFYKVVAVDSRAPRDGGRIEEVGYYNPRRPQEFHLNAERVELLLRQGAKMTNTVANLFKRWKRENPNPSN